MASWLPSITWHAGSSNSSSSFSGSRGARASDYEPVLDVDVDYDDDGHHLDAFGGGGSPSKRQRRYGGRSPGHRRRSAQYHQPRSAPRWRSWPSLVLIASAGVVLVIILVVRSGDPSFVIDERTGMLSYSTRRPPSKHPILQLIAAADEQYAQMEQRRSAETSLQDAVDDYVRTWGMQPPEGFERW